MKVLSPPAHGVLITLLITVLAMAPTALTFTRAFAMACYLAAGALLLVTLLTDFTMGLVRLLPYRRYGWLELVSSLFFLGSPFLFGFTTQNPTARNFFMVFGGTMFVLWGLTDWSGKVHSDMTDNPDEDLVGRSDHYS